MKALTPIIVFILYFSSDASGIKCRSRSIQRSTSGSGSGSSSSRSRSSHCAKPLFGGLNPWEFHQVSGVSLKIALARIDHANEQDINMMDDSEGHQAPKEFLYSQRLYEQVLNLDAEAGETLRLAARSQHIQRWKIPRDSYPMTKPGYLEWRANLKTFHANTVGRILEEVGYNPETIERVKELVLKKNPKDPDAQTLEDALCLVFLQWQLDEFIAKHDDAKTINALRKSWGKMSERGRSVALKLPLSGRASELVAKALSGS